MKFILSIVLFVSLFSCRKDVVIIEESPEIMIYPTPFESSFFIQSKAIKKFDMKLYSITGQILMTKNNIPSGLITVNTDSLTNGIYYVEIESKEINLIRKLIKM
jgi:hypothetical protein